MRSSLRFLRSGTTGRPLLRRMKTAGDLAGQSHQMHALQGQSLETLARFGGCSFLAFPADFAPAPLKLPVCFAATISYLMSHGKWQEPYIYICMYIYMFSHALTEFYSCKHLRLVC
jgi:hypothetical protein